MIDFSPIIITCLALIFFYKRAKYEILAITQLGVNREGLEDNALQIAS